MIQKHIAKLVAFAEEYGDECRMPHDRDGLGCDACGPGSGHTDTCDLLLAIKACRAFIRAENVLARAQGRPGDVYEMPSTWCGGGQWCWTDDIAWSAERDGADR